MTGAHSKGSDELEKDFRHLADVDLAPSPRASLRAAALAEVDAAIAAEGRMPRALIHGARRYRDAEKLLDGKK